MPKFNKKRTSVIVVALCLLLGAGLSAVLLNRSQAPDQAPAAPVAPEPPAKSSSAPANETEPPPESEASVPEVLYPVGKLVNSKIRSEYIDGQLRINIPRLDYEGGVLGGTDSATLNKGLGLFDYATLPSTKVQNANTSIAGHRDIYGKEFYYIDTIEPGDLIYLTYGGALYTYEVESNFVTHDQDWEPIRIKDYACVTLQSCTPINVATERIFVVGRQISAEEGADFPEQ